MTADLDATFFTMRTVHGTSVGFVGEPNSSRLVHGAEARPAVLIRIAGASAACLLVDPDANFHQYAAIDPEGSLLSFRMERAGDGSIMLRRPSTACYLSAHSGTTAISIDRPHAAAWEQFRVQPIDASAVAPSNLEIVVTLRESQAIEPSGQISANAIVSMASSQDVFLNNLATAMIRLSDIEALLPVVGRLSRLESYGFVFAALRDRLSKGEDRSEHQLNRRLAREIAQFDWSIGEHSTGNPQVVEPHLGKLVIGRYCTMDACVIILGGRETDTASSYKFSDLSRLWPTVQASVGLAEQVSKDVTIGNDVWIGTGALILPGVVIGDGAIIGAHAVAHGVIPPYAVVIGNPGKIVHYRFEERTIKKLLLISWWNWPDHDVDRFVPLLLDKNVDAFIRSTGIIEEDPSSPFGLVPWERTEPPMEGGAASDPQIVSAAKRLWNRFNR